jgi:hypothetical protein
MAKIKVFVLRKIAERMCSPSFLFVVLHTPLALMGSVDILQTVDSLMNSLGEPADCVDKRAGQAYSQIR